MTTIAQPEVIPAHVTRVNEAKTPSGPGRPGASTAHITASTAHLSVEDIERIGAELEAIRDEVMSSLGESDARYIRRVIRTQRGLEIAGRLLLPWNRRVTTPTHVPPIPALGVR